MDPVNFGRYKLVSLVGEGGMAKVYLAVLSGPMGFEKEVALKKIDARLTQDDRFVKALINEARLGGQLRHKNIVEVYEFNQVGEDYYLAMEYVNGWTLDTIVKNCRNAGKHIPPSVCLQIAIQTCRGLEYAHTLRSKDGSPMNLVHRDLKPANIMISKAGDAKIMDFGIAKADSNLYKTTAADITKGTPIYMSPEQVTGSSKLTGRSDLFSMGSILHELVCLDVIFKGDNLLAIMHKVLQADTREAVQNVKERIPGLEEVLKKAMTKKPEDRYASAGEMERDLQSLLDKLPSQVGIFDWLQEYQSSIERKTGGDGAPGKGHPAGTQSLPGMGETEDELGSFTQAFFSQGDQGGAGASQLTPTSAGAGGEGGSPAESDMGELTKQFFQTDASAAPATATPEAAQLGPAPSSSPATPIPGPSPVYPPPSSEPEPRKKSRLGLVIGILVVLIVVLLGGVVGVAVIPKLLAGGVSIEDYTPSADATPTPAEDQTPEPTTEDGVVDATPEDGSESETPTPAATVQPAIIFASSPSGADVYIGGSRVGRTAYRFESGSPGKRYSATYKKSGYQDITVSGVFPDDGTVTVRETMQRVGKVETPTVATPTPEPSTPPPDTGGTAYLTINAKPWATIWLDGNLLGNTPKKRVEIPAGSHTVLLKCGPCAEPQEKTLTFSVKAGETYTSVRNEFQP